MIRVKSLSRKSHKNILKLSKGYKGRSNNVFRVAFEKIEKARIYNYIHRRLKKRLYKNIHTNQINAFCKRYGTSYSVFVHNLSNMNILLNKKMLSQLMLFDSLSARSLVNI